MRYLTRSLRARLVGLAALTTLIVLSVAAAIATWQIRQVTASALTDAARTRLAAVQDDVTPSGQLDATVRVRRTATYAQVLDATGRVVSASPALTDVPPLLTLAQARRGLRQPQQLNLTSPDLDLAAIAAPHVVRGGGGAVIVAVDSQGFLAARQQLQRLMLLGVPLVVVLTAGLAWLVTGRALRTVTQLAEDADAVSVSDAGRGLNVDSHDRELVRLVDALNRMLSRLGTHYATNLAVATETTHRLRTPLATLRAEAELALLDDEPGAAHAALLRIIGDADRLTGVVDRLLSATSGHRDVRDLGAALETVATDWQRQAAAHGRQALVRRAGQGSVDLVLLRAVVDPLVENAIRYAAASHPVIIDVETQDELLTARVHNHGSGVPAELREGLFQPWIGQSNGGLGLWLAREAARSAGGDAWCEVPGPPDTTFVARLPLSGQEPAHTVQASST